MPLTDRKRAIYVALFFALFLDKFAHLLKAILRYAFFTSSSVV